MIVLSIFILAPIFVSLNSYGDVTLDRVGGYTTSYFLSIPVSFFALSFLYVKHFKVLFKSKCVLIFSIYSVLILIFSYIYLFSINIGLLKTIIWANVFIGSIYIFSSYFRNKFTVKYTINNIENSLIKINFLILIIVIVSDYSLGRYTFAVSDVKIYNFEQYFAFIFIPFLAVLQRKSYLLVILASSSVYYVCSISANMTALVLVLTIFVVISINNVTNILRSKLVYAIALGALVLLSVLWVIILPFTVDYLSSYSLMVRGTMITNYYSSLEWFQVLFPFLHESRGAYTDMHNQTLELFIAYGFLGFILYYYLLLRILLNFPPEYRVMGLSVALVVFIGGNTVSPLLHVYLLIALSFYIALYNASSSITRSNIRSVDAGYA